VATYRYPVLVWEDHAGSWGACLLREEGHVWAHARSEAEAMRQARDYVQYLDREGVMLPEPDLQEVTLAHVKVPVRPEYRRGGKVFPCDESITLRVACIHGRKETGLRVGWLPLVGVSFAFYPNQDMRSLVKHYVQQALQGSTPAALSRFLPPKSAALRNQAVTVRRRVKAWRGELLEALRAVGEPLGERAVQRQFTKPWEREDEVRDLTRRLTEERGSVLLVGEPGVGKTTVLAEVARTIERQAAAEDQVRGPTQHRFWITSGPRMIAGMKYLGAWEERCEMVISQLSEVGGVLCLESLLDVVLSGGRTPQDSVANFFVPYLQSGELRIVAETSPDELQACRRLLPGLVERFQLLAVPTFERRATLRVLGRLAESCAVGAHLQPGPDGEPLPPLERGAVETIERLFRRFAPYQAPPGPAARFLRERFEEAERELAEQVTVEQVVDAFLRRTGLPERFLRDELPLDKETLLDELRAQVLGQERACVATAELALSFKAGLNDPQRPIGVLLFCGPTGVGKTALARTLARTFFGARADAQGRADGARGTSFEDSPVGAPQHREVDPADERLIRLDMSEYSGHGAVERLLGEPDGSPSELVRSLRRQPFCVLLLDEIEKASPAVFDALLTVFDEGRLSDPFGRTTWFRSAVIVMTSNLGAGREEALGFAEERAGTYEDDVMDFFRPELFNRIDHVVVFDPLEREIVRRIARKELAAVAQREGLTRAGLALTWSEALVDLVAERGFDRRYGARPLQRTLEQLVVTPLARALVEHPDWREGTVHLKVAADGAVVIERTAP
jgi:ATP-dependent Clp protease ATP-binding subunit ClpC